MATTAGQDATTHRRAVVGAVVVVAVVVLALWQVTGNSDDTSAAPPVVAGAPILQASGELPFDWTVTVAPGEGGRLCGHSVVGDNVVDRTGAPCSALVGPDAIGNELFGTTSSSGSPAGQTITHGLVDPDVTRVEVELADGSTEAAVVTGGSRPDDPDSLVNLWVFASTGSTPVARVAHTEDGATERIDLGTPGDG